MKKNSNDLVEKCYDLLACKTSKAARDIIDSIPEDKLKYVALFLHGKYHDLLTNMEDE